MIIILKQQANRQDIEKILEKVHEKGLEGHVSQGASQTVIGLVGDTKILSVSDLEKFSGVERVVKVTEPYKKANRKFHPEDSIIMVAGQPVGAGHFPVIAGPCSVESEEQIITIARSIKANGATMLRGGAYKPRTSPYSFQGLELEGLRLLKRAKEETGLPIVTELMSVGLLDAFMEDVDMIQIGARNMQNFDLLKAVGRTQKPILLKRGLSATIEEWLMSAEYIMAEGNPNVILCERGIRTYETITRNTLDLQAIPVIHRLSHLPIIVDPSHAGGYTYLVPSMSKAAIVGGANGLMVEVHNDPANAWSDGQQCLDLEQFSNLMQDVRALCSFEKQNLNQVGE